MLSPISIEKIGRLVNSQSLSEVGVAFENAPAFTPVFIIGVPRSGTTLLRVLFDSHSQIAALPETPWLLGAYGSDASLRGLVEDLTDGPYGAVRNVSGIEPSDALAAGRRFLEELFKPVLIKKNKRHLVFKTPHDIRHLDFLTKFMPDARYIHITRDGRDVCLSQLAKKGSFFRDLKEFGRLSYANAFRRWAEWEQHIRSALYRDGIHVAHIRYEDLVKDPHNELRRLCDFLNVPFERGMLDYAAMEHDYPAWEAGSTDVAARNGISTDSLGAWRRTKITTEMLYTLNKYDDFLVSLGYPSNRLSPNFWDRLSIVFFRLVKRPIDLASSALRHWRNRRSFPALALRVLSTVALLGLTAHFLIPARLLLSLASDGFQPVLCFVVALCFEAAFGPALARQTLGRSPYMRAIFKMAALMLAYIGILELGQAFAPGRHPAFGDFAFNAFGVALATILLFPFFRRAENRSPSA